MDRIPYNKTDFDPALLNDAIATETSWTPVQRTAIYLCSHQLTSVNSGRMAFCATTEAKQLFRLHLGIGSAAVLAALGFTIYAISTAADQIFRLDALMAFIIGSTFMWIGADRLYRELATIVFDYSAGFCWRGRQAPKTFAEQNIAKHFVRLDRIHALQLLSQYNRGKTSYWSYQLNLILKDGNRINVLHHGDESRLRSNAAELAAFLRAPVWDGI